MANELGTWGIVTDPYNPPERGPENDIGSCGCVTYGVGAPVDADGQNNDVYVDTDTQTAYQKQDGSWTVILSGGGGGGQQVYKNAGDPNGVVTPTVALPCICLDTTTGIIYQKTDLLLTSTGWV